MTDHTRKLHHCDHCGKWSYVTRKAARRAMRTLHPGERRLRAYPCPRGVDVWHFGHLLRLDEAAIQSRGGEAA